MRERHNISGQTFHYLTAITPVWDYVSNKGRSSQWYCHCKCGNRKIVQLGKLRSGRTLSCGCLTHELRSLNKRTHGATIGGIISPTYRVWEGICRRTKPNSADSAKYYYDKGIRMCREWADYRNFLADMGERPSLKHTIDRIDNNKGYEPANCKWSTWLEQNTNRSITLRRVWKGKLRSLGEIYRLEHPPISRNLLTVRISKGWTIERALETPFCHSAVRTPRSI